MTKFKMIASWAIIVLLAAAFIAAGSGKLLGVEMLHQSFANMGLPSWFGYFIGACEVAGGVGLLVRKWSALAALGLFAVMLGAIGYHLAFDPMAMALPAVVLALLALMAFISRKGDSLLSAIH